MKRLTIFLSFAFFLAVNSQILITESQAAPRPCTGKEVALEISYRAQIAVQEFYSPGSSTLSALKAQLQNLYNKCESEGFKAGTPKAKAPVCSTADTSKLIDIRSAYSQQVDLEAQNSNEIAAQEKEYSRAISTGQTARAQQINLRISALVKEIQYHYRMQMLYQAAFFAYATDCKNSSVTLPKRTLGQESTNSTNPALNDLPQRFIGFFPGDVDPDTILGVKCGPKAPRQVSISSLDSSRKWIKTNIDWTEKYDLGSKYALQLMTIPVDPISVNLSNGTWYGVTWPYTTQYTFSVQRCDSGTSENRAKKQYDIDTLKNGIGTWARQEISNLDGFVHRGDPYNYRVDQVVAQDLSDPVWKCSVKKPKTSTVKKNGKNVKVTKPAVSDFRVNVSGDGSSVSVWECDDIESGKFIEVQKLLISESWDVSIKDSSNNNLWVQAMNDPRHRNWTWACPAGTGDRTCRQVSGLG
jgi:hypothetical protein